MQLNPLVRKIRISQALKVAGFLLILMGLIVIFGWYTHLEFLMRVLPAQVPVQYNTALLFILCGLTLVFFQSGKRYPQIVTSSLVLGFSLLCLLQYFFNLDFGIDQLFFTPYITSGVQKPGRMAPNTSLSFAFSSLALLIAAFPPQKATNRHFFQVVILGSLTTALGAVAFLGYLTGISTAYGWGQQTRMAILTTFGMMTLGLCIVGWGWFKAQEINKMLPRWLPLLIFITGLTVTLSLWQAMLSEEGIQLDQTTSQAAKTFQRDLTDGLKTRLLLLDQLARRLEATALPQQEAWKQDIAAEVSDFGGISAIALADPTLNITWIEPREGNDRLVNRAFPVSDTTRTALLAAAQSHERLVSPTENNLTGETVVPAGFVAYFPINRTGANASYMLGIFQNQAFIKNILSNSPLNPYRLTITSDKQTIFYQESPGGPPISGAVQQVMVNLNGIEWQIQLEPGPQVRNAQQSLLSSFSLFGGILISALLAAITLLAQISWQRARRVELSNQELLRSKELYSTLARNLPETAVLLFDKNLRFTLAEGAILNKWGLEKKAVEGRTIYEASPGVLTEKMEKGFLKALEGQPSIFEEAYRQTFIQIQIFPVQNELEKNFTGMVVMQDITQLKRNDQLKSEFISTVSHELRTPLTSIQGSLGLVLGGITGQLNTQTQTMLEIAHKNCSRLVRLINDLLDMEKIESGKMVSHKKPVELLPLIEQAIQANRAYAQQYGVTYHLSEFPDVIKVNADSDQMIQVLNNLLSNAAKYSPPEGTVEVRVGIKEGKVRVSVTDQGKGIPEEFHSRIFQKFSQADSSDTRQKGGTGLGLSIVKALVAQHDGEVSFTTIPGKGTTFFFDLPVLAIETMPEPLKPAAQEAIIHSL